MTEIIRRCTAEEAEDLAPFATRFGDALRALRTAQAEYDEASAYLATVCRLHEPATRGDVRFDHENYVYFRETPRKPAGEVVDAIPNTLED